jgi:polysaccharide pyruvyl transferase WcaK-like protein
MSADPDATARPVRVLIENSEYWLSNIGDLAMMDVTVRRLRERWPEARIGVLTNTPALLRAYFPGVEPVTPRGRRVWAPATAFERVCELAGPRWVGPAAIGWVTAKAWVPQKWRGLRRRTRVAMARVAGSVGLRGTRPGPVALAVRDLSAPVPATGRVVPHNTRRAVHGATLVLALGGGYVTDADAEQAHRVLTLLEYAHHHGVRTAMVGQGLGPAEDPALVSRLEAVLPRVDLIGLRERLRGPELLARAGVPDERVVVTGDDAIELSHAVRSQTLGSNVGICLRIAGYSPVSATMRSHVQRSLHAFAREVDAGLSPILIAEYRSQDRRSTLPLTHGYHETREPLHRFARPQEVARQVSGCRILVTGAYHAAVFALAQGVPVVALTSSQYYDDKFLGLADMFGGGLRLVHLSGDRLAADLTSAMREAWEQTPHVRPRLLDSAERQIVTSRAALSAILDRVDVGSCL